MLIRVFLLYLIAGFYSVSCEDEPPLPKWSAVYTVSGVLSIPYAELKEPFYAWYDADNSKSRIDYYGGMVKTYQLAGSGKDGDYGINLKLAPVTTEHQLNVETCLQNNGSEETPVAIQSILPNLTGFKYEGDYVMRGQQTQKWSLMEKYGLKENKYHMWLKVTNSKGDGPSVIPVRYEMRGFNSLLGSHYDHYYLDYDDYNTDKIYPGVFQVDSNLTCIGFPGPGERHVSTFNPMREFVHPTNTQHVEEEFARFINKHGKKYKNDLEHSQRKEIFRQNLRYINSHNRANHGFSLTVNHLADKSDSETSAMRGRVFSKTDNGASPFPYSPEYVSNTVKDIPRTFDWRILGAVTPVKDQSVCGSCWSFGTTGAVEGALFLQNGGTLQRLSQQALIDCSWGYGNNGCDGGEDFRAYQWIMKHGGLPLEEDYGSYLGQDGQCHADSLPKFAAIKSYVNVTSGNENALRLAIYKHGPISVAIDASQKTFSFYSHGVYYDPKCKNGLDQLDHAVLAVGYGTIQGEDYWLVKNSWSTYWGNDGYILMAAKNNNCGVQTTPTYVVL